jgi:hypothetical protein
MKKSLSLLCTAGLTCLTLSSCFEHDVTLTIKKDGSGTISEVTQLSAEASANLSRMPGGQNPFASLTDKAKVTKRASQFGAGVTVQDIKSEDKGGQITSTVTFHFNDINQLKYSFGSSIQSLAEGMKSPGAPIPEQPATSYTYAGGTLTIKMPKPNTESSQINAAAAANIPDQQLEAMKGIYKGMRMIFKIEVPEGISSTNAAYHDDKSITLSDIQMEKLLDDKNKARQLIGSRGDVDAIGEIAKSIDGLKVESKRDIEVKIK